MIPIEFKQQTVVLQKPSNMTDEQCGSMPILQLQNGTCVSCWRMNWKERLRILLTGIVWVGVLSGKTQPPIYVAASQPFSDEDAFATKEAIESRQKFIEYMDERYGLDAIARAKSFDRSGTKTGDVRRTFVISEPDLIEAGRHGIKYIFGLRLVS